MALAFEALVTLRDSGRPVLRAAGRGAGRRVAAVTPADVQRVARDHMPPPDRVAIVVVGQGAQVRAPLEAKFGAIEVVAPDACEKLSVPPR